MPVEISTTGTHATDYADLLDKLVIFATDNGWEEVENSADKVVLKGEGAGTDEIFVAFQKYADVGTDAYGWRLNGYSGYQDGYLFREQQGAIQVNEYNNSGQLCLPLWNDEIPYWFIVNSRRIIVVAKVSSTYQCAYAGFYLPFASPGQYPYPLCVGGSYVGTSAQTTTPRYSGSSNQASNFWDGKQSQAGGGATLFTRLPGGAWYAGYNDRQNTIEFWSSGLFPYNQLDVAQMRQPLDDEPLLTPIEIVARSQAPNHVGRMGELDGVLHISGFSQSSEDIVTIDTVDYLVVQNVFRTGIADYAAIRLT